MGDSLGHSLEACIRAWRDRRPYPSADAGEELADYHFSRGDFDAAAAAYATCEPPTEQIRAKRGWCLAVLDRCDEAKNFLTPENCGASSAELAVLAATIAGGWNRNKLYGESGVSSQEAQTRRQQVEELVHRALHTTEPPQPLAFFAYMDLVEWYRDREAALAVAERAVSLYPFPALIEWHARLLRTLGRPNEQAFNTLLLHVPNEPGPSYVGELFDSAMMRAARWIGSSSSSGPSKMRGSIHAWHCCAPTLVSGAPWTRIPVPPFAASRSQVACTRN